MWSVKSVFSSLPRAIFMKRRLLADRLLIMPRAGGAWPQNLQGGLVGLSNIVYTVQFTRHNKALIESTGSYLHDQGSHRRRSSGKVPKNGPSCRRNAGDNGRGGHAGPTGGFFDGPTYQGRDAGGNRRYGAGDARESLESAS